jgi:bifunctional non-homologous end joining protein LigD
VLAKLGEPIRESPVLEASLSDLISSVKAHGLEGLVAKRRDSRYEPGQRSGVWQKMRVNQGQSLVIAGYTLGARNFDAVVFGYYEGGRLMYAGRTRSGFTAASRDRLFKRLQALAAAECPFANLPETRSGRWGEGLTAEKMKDCRWLKPALVGQFEFVEWTPDGHLRHSRYMGLREDKSPLDVTREVGNAGGEQKTKCDILAAVKRCRVSFMDSDGVEHAVELDARSLYEAVGLAIDRFRRCEHVSYDPQGMHEFTVESREPSTQHRLTRNMFDAWLRRPGGSPADVARKSKLKGLLGDVA